MIGKRFGFVVLAGFFSASRMFGLTVAELEKAAVEGVASLKGDARNELPPAEVFAFEGYVEGFLHSLKTGGMISLTPDGRNVSYAPAEWMSQRKDTAESMIKFIRLHRPDGAADKPAGKVMTAWYLWHCDGSDSKAKRRACSLLEEVYGSEFPGQSEMKNEVGRLLLKEAKQK